jgi:DNA-binding CsgD family transcriptional regulator
VLEIARRHYSEVRLYIFGDHGMANCSEFIDLRRRIEKLDVRMGRDYAVVYDSTMARFWAWNERARQRLTEALTDHPCGQLLDREELTRLGVEETKTADAVDAVLGASGHRVPRRHEGPAGLTRREVEVLVLLARGLSNKAIAAQLVVSPKTVGHHIEHIYRKIGSSTRAAASLFAMQNGLLPELDGSPEDGANAR